MESTIDFAEEVKDMANEKLGQQWNEHSKKIEVVVDKATNLETTFFNLNSPYYESKQEFENACKEEPFLKYFDWDWCLHKAYKNGEIIPYTKWLQRLEQIADWEEKNSYKFNSFIQSFITNDTTLVPYLLIPIEVLLDIIAKDKAKYKEMKVTQEKNTGNISKDKLDHVINEIENYITLVEEIESDILKFQNDGAKFLILDGNNRCSQAWVPFFNGKKLFPLHKTDGKIRNIKLGIASYVEDGEPELSEQSLFPKEGRTYLPWCYNSNGIFDKDLQQLQREVFDKAVVEIKVVTGGTIEDISDLIISYNEGTSWTPFEKLCISGTYISLLINNYTDITGKGTSLFNLSRTSVGWSGKYSLEKKGDLLAFAEVMGYFLNPESPISAERIYGQSNDELNEVTKVEKLKLTYDILTHISVLYRCQDAKLKNNMVFTNDNGNGKELVYRCMPSFMFMLMNIQHPGVVDNCNIWGKEYDRSLKLDQINIELLKEFQQFHVKKCSPYIEDKNGKQIVNPDFEQLLSKGKKKNGKDKKPKIPVAKNGTYAFSRDAAGGGGSKMEDRHREIAMFIDENIKRWHDSGLIQYMGERVALTKKQEAEFKKKYGTCIDWSKNEKGHTRAVKKPRSFEELKEEMKNPVDFLRPEPIGYNRMTKNKVDK
jgi:hypothetical protein